MQKVEQLGLRERKKLMTRAQIVDTADTLFMSEGFEAVTLDRVADVSILSVRTVLRYFPTKEALALSHEYEALERIREELPSREGNVLDFWRGQLAVRIAEVQPKINWWRQRNRLIHDYLPVYSRLLSVHAHIQELLAAGLEEEMDPNDTLGPQLLASMLVSGNEAVNRSWFAGRGKFDGDALLDVVDYAEELFAGRFAH